MQSETDHLQSLSLRALVVAPVRMALGLAGAGAAIAAGSPRPGALLAFLAAAVGLVFVVVVDPRRHFVRLPDDPPEAPAGAVEDGLARLALSAVFPSTVGVAALAVAALFFEPTQLLAERRTGLRLFLVRGTQQIVARGPR